DGTVQAVAAILRRQVAGDNHGARGNAAVGDLAGLTVVYLGALSDVDAHRDHRALAHDHTLDDFRARADEAVVLDDGGIGLQGFEHTADADAARQVHVLADLGAGADRGPGIHHGAAVDIGAD